MGERIKKYFMNVESKQLKKQFGKNLILNENLSKYNWFNLGGPADIFFRPENKDQLIDFLKKIKKSNVNVNVIGAGSNTLIRDLGIKGVVIKLGSKFSQIKLISENIIEVGAAALDRKVSDFAKENLISGMEFLSCIPGSVGGAVIMNSGCYGEDISKIFLSLKAINSNGEIETFTNKQIKFSYRGNDLNKNLIILSAIFQGKMFDSKKILEKQTRLINMKKNSQPSRIKTCGSTFKNPESHKAWELIKNSECANLKVGGARISEKHSNFFLNNGDATSSDIEKLIDKVKEKVFKKTGIELELELQIVGKK